MKKTYFWMMALCIFGAFAACSDDDNNEGNGDGGDGGETPVVYKTISSFVRTTPEGEMMGQTQTYLYDYSAEGKLTGYKSKSQYTNSEPTTSTVDYSYAGNTIKMTSIDATGEVRESVTYTVEGGKVKSTLEKEGSAQTNGEVTYDAAGYLQKIVTTDMYYNQNWDYSDPFNPVFIDSTLVTETYTETFTFENGNLVKYALTEGEGSDQTIDEYTFIYDQNGKYENKGSIDLFSQIGTLDNNYAGDLYLLNIAGKRSAHMPIRITNKYTEDGVSEDYDNVNISYVTDKDGYIIEYTRDDDSDGVKYNVNYK